MISQTRHLMSYLVEYESLVRQEELDYQTMDLRDFRADSEAGKITIISHSGEGEDTLRLSFPSGEVEFMGCLVNLPGRPVVVDDQELAIAFGRYLLIQFNPEELFKAIKDAGLFNQVMGRILSEGLDIILGASTTKDEDELNHWIETRVFYHKERVRSSEIELENLLEEVLEHRAEIRNKFKKYFQLKQMIDFHKHFTEQLWKKRVRDEYHLLKKLVPVSYSSIKFTRNGLEAITPKISIEYDGVIYEIGRFEVKINLERLEIGFRNLDNSIDGYPHPHINNSGIACWGSLEEDIERLIAEEDLYGLLVVIGEFLRSYNPENPYLKIEYWDPDYDPEEDERMRYEECREQVSLRDCVECGDENCPYYSDAEEVCYEDREVIECASCPITFCRYHRNALLECQSTRLEDPIRCISCESRDCPFAGDENACYEAHQGEFCRSCDMTDCAHRRNRRAING